MSGEQHMKKLVVILIAIILTLSTGCVEKKIISVPQDNKADNSIVYSLGKMPEDLLLLNDSSIREKDLLLCMFEGLVKADENGNVLPALAESWTIGKDDITYTFKLRDNANWSNGTPITARDFQVFFRDILSSKQKNIYAYQLDYIFGAQEYRNNKKTFDGVAIRVVDDKTLEIRLNSPVSYFLKILSQPVYGLRKINDDLNTWKKSYSNIQYSGPFMIDVISEEGEITLLKNEFYYDYEEVRSERVYIIPSTGSENALAKFNTNKINMFINPPVSETKSLILDGNAETIPVDIGSSINFNLKRKGIVSSASFRKAISLAINREHLLDQDMNYNSRMASAYVPYNNEASMKYIRGKSIIDSDGDTEQSKKLLEESSYNKKEKIRLVYMDNIENKRLCDSVVKDIKEDLDINIESKGYNETELAEVLKSGDYHIFLMNYASLYDDPISILEAWTSNSDLNLFGYKNLEYDKLLLKAKYEKDIVKREEYLMELEKLLLNDSPAIPMYFHNIVLCRKPNIKGVYTTKEGNIKLDRAYIDEY
jgi:peptide/nickel transport system substrate-binding protein